MLKTILKRILQSIPTLLIVITFTFILTRMIPGNPALTMLGPQAPKESVEQLEEELCSIVDMGGCVENVMINHRVYGHMEAELHINSRRKVMEFIGDIKSGKSSPLKNITSNYHYHKVSADSEETLDMIEEVLRQKEILIETA